MRIGFVDLPAAEGGAAANKDLSGGMGTRSVFGYSPFSKLFQLFKERSVCVPVLSFAYLVPIVRQLGLECRYFTGIPDEECDVFLINSSIVDYRNELRAGERIMRQYPSARVGFFGTFASVRPKLFLDHSHFTVCGSVEALFLYDRPREERFFEGILRPSRELDIEDLSTPDYSLFDYRRFGYRPALVRKPFLTLLASRGCPCPCSYYCPYTIMQGSRYNPRSVTRLVEDVAEMTGRYGARSIQFRDPIFTLDRKRVELLCDRFREEGFDLHWGCETRPDSLDRDLLDRMHDAGLRNINLGIESSDAGIMRRNRRVAPERDHQEEMVRYCDSIGVKVTAFYIIGLQGDDRESVLETFRYARKLNTHLAQVTISTPYPGTEYFDDLESRGLLLTDDYEKYDINHLVFAHPEFTPEELFSLKERFYREYYLRLSWLWKFIRCQARDILS